MKVRCAMEISVFETTTKQFKMTLQNLKNILIKTDKWADSKKINMTTVFNLRLAPDMFPLGKQIQVACDNAKGGVMRLTSIEVPAFEDTEQTTQDFIQRIDKTIAILDKVNAESFLYYEKKSIEFPWNPGFTLSGTDYLTQFLIPNFYFHVTVAYSILRSNGVDLGKGDYIGPINFVKK